MYIMHDNDSNNTNSYTYINSYVVSDKTKGTRNFHIDMCLTLWSLVLRMIPRLVGINIHFTLWSKMTVLQGLKASRSYWSWKQTVSTKKIEVVGGLTSIGGERTCPYKVPHQILTQFPSRVTWFAALLHLYDSCEPCHLKWCPSKLYDKFSNYTFTNKNQPTLSTSNVPKRGSS